MQPAASALALTDNPAEQGGLTKWHPSRATALEHDHLRWIKAIVYRRVVRPVLAQAIEDMRKEFRPPIEALATELAAQSAALAEIGKEFRPPIEALATELAAQSAALAEMQKANSRIAEAVQLQLEPLTSRIAEAVQLQLEPLTSRIAEAVQLQLRGGLTYKYLGDMTALIELHDGTPFIVDTMSLDIAAGLIIHRRWEEWIEPYITGWLRPGMTFVDVGAHVGYFATLGGKAVGAQGKIIAIEPNPRLTAILRQNLRINGVSNAKVVQTALGSRCGQTVLWVRDGENGGGYVTNDSNACEEAAGFQKIPVQITRLDDLLDCEVDLIKVDAEGQEVDILIGARQTIGRSRKIRLIIELNPSAWVSQGHDVREFLHSLVSQGLGLAVITTEGVTRCDSEELIRIADRLSYVTCFLAERISAPEGP
jgi:FkbM family methyltransferase